MPIPKRILRKDIQAESLEELLDADYIRLVVDETGLNIQVTEKGDRALFEPYDGRSPDEDLSYDEESSCARFKNKFWFNTTIAAVIILFIILFILKYKIHL
jgi:hypothetical protein